MKTTPRLSDKYIEETRGISRSRMRALLSLLTRRTRHLYYAVVNLVLLFPLILAIPE